MILYFNNEALTITPGSTLLEVLMTLDLPSQPYAVAINLNFVPKSQYALTHLAASDRIDLVVATQGG